MDHDIVDDLFRKYYNEAMLYTISLCRNRTVAEDIVSDAFFRSLSADDESIRNFKPWLLTVCRNEFLTYCRKTARVSGEELTEELSVDTEDLAAGLIRNEEYHALYLAMDRLRPAQKEVITLFYFSGLSVAQIAAVMKKSEANVKVLLYRGREQLKLLLEEKSHALR